MIENVVDTPPPSSVKESILEWALGLGDRRATPHKFDDGSMVQCIIQFSKSLSSEIRPGQSYFGFPWQSPRFWTACFNTVIVLLSNQSSDHNHYTVTDVVISFSLTNSIPRRVCVGMFQQLSLIGNVGGYVATLTTVFFVVFVWKITMTAKEQ